VARRRSVARTRVLMFLAICSTSAGCASLVENNPAARLEGEWVSGSIPAADMPKDGVGCPEEGTSPAIVHDHSRHMRNPEITSQPFFTWGSKQPGKGFGRNLPRATVETSSLVNT
jgi:hypothetical protein